MYKLHAYITNDGSVGLFSPQANDIYHSTYGALSEAYEKFILPANFENYFSGTNEIKILDICFGIGYNTKSFLNYFFENIYSKNTYNYTIDTNNIKYNDKIYTDNNFVEKFIRLVHGRRRKFKIFIKAIDTDKNLAFLSPFFVTENNKIKNTGLDFENAKISGLLAKKSKSKFKLKKEINNIILSKIVENHPEIFDDEDFREILTSKEYRKYFDKCMLDLFKFYESRRGKYTPYSRLSACLHNIYYRYISNRNKRALKALKTADFTFDLKIEDARQTLLKDENLYNYIFLDAFTPSKCPCLWSVDFFKLLYGHVEDDGVILTYSSAASIRNAFLHAGFYIGKIYNPVSKKFVGTIATKNRVLIQHELSEYELGLLKTRAGIFYRDEELTLENEAIIAAHKSEVETSDLMSSTKYIKSHR